MQSPGDQNRKEQNQQCDEHRGQVRREDAIDSRIGSAQRQTHQRKKFRGAPQGVWPVSQPRQRQPGKKLKCRRNIMEDSVHSLFVLTPAEENVAISENICREDSITGMANTAPVPSPRRIFKLRIGVSPM